MRTGLRGSQARGWRLMMRDSAFGDPNALWTTAMRAAADRAQRRDGGTLSAARDHRDDQQPWLYCEPAPGVAGHGALSVVMRNRPGSMSSASQV
jgi:hypothetical protein